MRELNTEWLTEATTLEDGLAVITVLAEDGIGVALGLKGSLDIEDAVELVGFKHFAVCISSG